MRHGVQAGTERDARVDHPAGAERTTAAGPPPDLLTGQVGAVLDQVRHGAAALLADLHGRAQPLRVLRLQVGAVRVELEWAGDPPTPAAAPPVPATAAAPASAGPVPSVGGAPAGGSAEDGQVGYVRAPTVGVFYRSPEPGAPPFVEVGDTVALGQQVAVVEAMKQMIPVEADRPGRVVRVLRGDGEPVEYGDPLLAVAGGGS